MPSDTNVDRAIYALLSKQCPAMWLGIPIGAGDVYFVNGFNGDDGNVGTNPDQPFETIAHAIGECANDNNDYIIVLRGGAETNIAIDKTRVHIIGLSPDGPQRYVGYAGGVTPVFTITTGNMVEIAGFQLSADATHPCILLTGMGWGTWIHRCSFGEVTAAQDGIRCDAEGLIGGLVENNYFGHHLERDGCRFLAPTRSVFRNNYFREIVKDGVGIYILGAGAEVSAIVDNYFYGAIAEDLDDGWAITTYGSGAIITNNHAMQTGDGTGKNPYRDVSPGAIGAKLNGWGMNYDGQAVTVPQTI